MEKKFYNNNEVENSEVIKLLKNLPKIKAPANFEFNLSTRIQNGNFDIPKENQMPKWLTWSLGPIAAIALSAVVFIFVFSNSAFQTENLLMQNPELRQSVNTVSNSKVPTSNGNLSKVAETEQNLKAVIEPNDVVIQRKPQFPFNDANSVNLDNYMNGENGNAQNVGNIQTVSGGQASVNFNGFGIPVKTNPKQLAAMRKQIDSLHTKNFGK